MVIAAFRSQHAGPEWFLNVASPISVTNFGPPIAGPVRKAPGTRDSFHLVVSAKNAEWWEGAPWVVRRQTIVAMRLFLTITVEAGKPTIVVDIPACVCKQLWP
jgi:hypothetical protein